MQPTKKRANGIVGAIVPDSGRDPETGRFTDGHPGGPGRPKGKRSAELRRELLAGTDINELRAVWAKLLELAKGGDLPAIKEVLDRTLGRPVQAVDVEATETGPMLIQLNFDDAG
jgi:hypothetical protein